MKKYNTNINVVLNCLLLLLITIEIRAVLNREALVFGRIRIEYE